MSLNVSLFFYCKMRWLRLKCPVVVFSLSHCGFFRNFLKQIDCIVSLGNETIEICKLNIIYKICVYLNCMDHVCIYRRKNMNIKNSITIIVLYQNSGEGDRQLYWSYVLLTWRFSVIKKKKNNKYIFVRAVIFHIII